MNKADQIIEMITRNWHERLREIEKVRTNGQVRLIGDARDLQRVQKQIALISKNTTQPIMTTGAVYLELSQRLLDNPIGTLTDEELEVALRVINTILAQISQQSGEPSTTAR